MIVNVEFYPNKFKNIDEFWEVNFDHGPPTK